MTNCYLPSVTQGTSWVRAVTWDDGNGDPIDVTGYSGRLQFRNGAGSLVLELSSTIGGVTVGTTDGLITLAMDAGQTASLPVGVLSFGLVMTAPDGTVTELISGALAVMSARVFGDSPPDDFPTLVTRVGIAPGSYSGSGTGSVIDCQGFGPTFVASVTRGTSTNPAANVVLTVAECDDQLSWSQIGDELTTSGANSVVSASYVRTARYLRTQIDLTASATVTASAVVVLRPL